MGWENGRRLAYLTTDDGQYCSQILYTYDANGIRDTKDIDGQTHTYITQNGKVVRETIDSGSGTKVLDFIYDESGNPFALKYSPDGGSSFTTYYYVLNLQGDVVMLIDENGNTAAKYSYNAWGNTISISGEMAYINPLRYRGYYYDNETRFYYLQSRYYDPAMHRFINADSLASTGQGFIGYNMFTYCNNCPVILSDIGGNMAGKFCTVMIEDGASTSYILDQNAENIGNLPLGYSSISHAGCGVVASYNALITLGNRKSFDEVLSYFNTDADLLLNGFAGMLHSEVTAYFRKLGYEVVETDDPVKIDIYAQDADACILWYMFDTSAFPGFGGHFAEFSHWFGGYEVRNVSTSSGADYFELPTSFAYANTRYYAIGIFIYDPLKS